jgi:cell wall-associated NlpC family hydrolase
MASIETLCDRMRYWCDEGNLGYCQEHRWDIYEGGECDCSSLVIHCLQEAGFDTGDASYTGNMSEELCARGWVRVANDGNPQRGDILLNDTHHVAVYIGSGLLCQASRNENHGANGGQPGDQDGYETNTRSYYDYPWNCYLRYGGSSTSSTESESGLGDTQWTGKLMVSEWQRQLGTTVDGKVSNQSTYIRYEILNHFTTDVFDGSTDAPNGSQMIVALQEFLNANGANIDEDGFCGPATVKALQTWLNATYGAGLDVDGYYGAMTSQAVGVALEAGGFNA